MDFSPLGYFYQHHKMIRSLLGLNIQHPSKILERVRQIDINAANLRIRLTSMTSNFKNKC